MKNSIESLWKTSFLDKEIYPKMNMDKLQSSKSILIIDKLKKHSKIDNLMLIPITVLVFLSFNHYGLTEFGAFIALCLSLLFMYNNKQLKSLNEIHIYDNNFDYLCRFRDHLVQMIAKYTYLLGLGLPFVGLISYHFFLKEHRLFQNTFGEIQFFQVTFSMAILSAIGIIAYRLSTHIVYGHLIKRLNNTIIDIQMINKE